MAFVFDLTTFQGGLYVDKQPGEFGTINFIIEPLGSSMWDFVASIFGKNKNKIIYGVPETDGYIFVPAASTAWNIDTYLILKTKARESLFEKVSEKHFSELFRKMQELERTRELEREAYETFRRERLRLRAEEISEIIRNLPLEEKKKLKEKFSEKGFLGD